MPISSWATYDEGASWAATGIAGQSGFSTGTTPGAALQKHTAYGWTAWSKATQGNGLGLRAT